VRAALLERQRAFAAQSGGAVLDGRDIGTVIAPDALAKLYDTASVAARAHRRWLEMQQRGEDAAREAIEADLAARDARDAARAEAPLRQASDAMLLDTSALSADEAVAAAIALVAERIAAQETNR
jgi:cytidylate kinase